MFTMRQTQILTLLIKGNNYVTAENMASELNVSKKTIHRDMSSINEILKSYDCAIEILKGRGYYCDSKQKEKIYSLLNEKKKETFTPSYQQTRIDWLIKKFILQSYKCKPMTIAKLAEELYISEATLKNDFKIVRKKLENYRLKIVKYQDKGLILKGNEIDIRKALANYILEEESEFSLESMVKLSKEEHNKIENIIVNTISKYRITVTDMGFTNLMIHIEIALSRLKANKTIKKSSYISVNESDPQFLCAKEISKNLETAFQCNIEYIEIVNIYQHLIAQKKILNLENELSVDNKLYLKLKEILKNIDKLYQSNFTSDNVLFRGLIVHLDAALNRIRYEMPIRNEMLGEIKNSYPYSMELAEILARDLENEYKIKINQNEVGFLALHFCGSIERNKINFLSRKHKVAIVCATGIGTSMVLNAKLKKAFGQELELMGTYASYQINMLNPQICDLIISTIPLNKTNGIPYLCVTPLLTDVDVKKIRSFLKFGSENRRTKISDLFNEDLLFADLQFKSKKDCINFLSTQLLNKGYIDEVCKDSIMEREKMATTEIGNYLSVPHNIKGEIYHNSICVGILKDPITWSYGKVQIILMITVRFSDINKESDFFLHIYQKFDSICKSKKIIEKKSIDYIKSLFSEEEFI